MKKTYETPSIEVVKFQYRDQVVTASGVQPYQCTSNWLGKDQAPCEFTSANRGNDA